MAFHVTLENSAGPIDERRVYSDDSDELKAAIRDLIDETAYFNDGDVIRIREV